MRLLFARPRPCMERSFSYGGHAAAARALAALRAALPLSSAAWSRTAALWPQHNGEGAARWRNQEACKKRVGGRPSRRSRPAINAAGTIPGAFHGGARVMALQRLPAPGIRVPAKRWRARVGRGNPKAADGRMVAAIEQLCRKRQKAYRFYSAASSAHDMRALHRMLQKSILALAVRAQEIPSKK